MPVTLVTRAADIATFVCMAYLPTDTPQVLGHALFMLLSMFVSGLHAGDRDACRLPEITFLHLFCCGLLAHGLLHPWQ